MPLTLGGRPVAGIFVGGKPALEVRRGSALVKGSAPVDPDRFMFFASRTQPPSGYAVDTTSIALTYFASKLIFGNAPWATRGFRFHFSGFSMAEGTGPQETSLAGNDNVIDGVTLIIDGTPYEADFSGSAGVAIVSGTKGAWCTFPTFTGDCPPDADFTVITRWHVASVGQKFVAPYRIQKHRGEKYWAAADATALAALISSEAATTAVLDGFYNIAPGNQTNSQLLTLGPDFMVAKGDWDGRPIVLGTGDSIGYGRQEVSAAADIRGNMGWFHKWLDNADPTYGRIPHYFIGCPSAQSARELATSAFLRWDILDDIKAFNADKYPFTIVLNQMGTNDANATYSTWKSRLTGLIARIKARVGTKVIQCTVPPQNALVAGNLGFSTAGLTVAALWINSGNRGLLNTDIRTNNAFGHDGFLDVDLAWAGTVDQDKFQPAGDMRQVGTILSVVPGDGSTTHPTGVTDWEPAVGEGLLVEYIPGTYAARQIIDVSPVGDGTFNVVFTNTYTTVVQANAKAYYGISPEGIHPWGSYTDHWVVPRLPQSDKAKLAA